MRENLLTRILGWLRAGYPQGIPSGDYVALMGVLHRSLTEDEVEALARELRAGEGGLDQGVSDERIREAIRHSALETPSQEDVNRVQARLALGGWPLAEVAEQGRD